MKYEKSTEHKFGNKKFFKYIGLNFKMIELDNIGIGVIQVDRHMNVLIVSFCLVKKGTY